MAVDINRYINPENIPVDLADVFDLAMANAAALGVITPTLASAITTLGSNQATAQTITASVNILSAGSATPHVRLKLTPTRSQKVVNKLGVTATIWPAVGASIDALGTAVATTLVDGAAAVFDPTSATQWYKA